MERYTQKMENEKYKVTGEVLQQEEEGYVGEAVERLARFEDAYEALEANYTATEEKLEWLRSQGKVKSVTFQQLLGRKMNYENLISLFEIHGIE